MKRVCLAVAAVLCGALNLSAEDVNIKGVHLCCGACVTGANSALEGIDGISDIASDRNTKTIAFKAKDEAAAKEAIESLAEAGFHGTATLGKKALPFPDSGAKKGMKLNQIVLTGLHLCCGACVEGAKEALTEVEGVAEVKIDRGERTATLIGKEIDVVSAVAALNKGGFHGTLKTAEKKKAAEKK